MILTLDIFFMAHKRRISVENLLLARRQREKILIINDECRDMIERKTVFIFNTCALLIMSDTRVTNTILPGGRGQKKRFLLNILSQFLSSDICTQFPLNSMGGLLLHCMA